MHVIVFVIEVLVIKSFTTDIAEEPINTSMYRHMEISTSFIVKSFCTRIAPVHNTRVLIHVILVVCTVTETFLTLVTIKLK